MRPLSNNDIESELSYAYVHAVASRAAASCRTGTRHEDNAGIDAELTGWGPFPDGGPLLEVDLKLQLKATIAQPVDHGSHFSYNLQGIHRYDDLRNPNLGTARILVVLFLPEDANSWLDLTEEQLIMRGCAYWLSLRGAPASSNSTSQVVYIPKEQRFYPDALRGLFSAVSRGDVPVYAGGPI